MLRPRDFDLVIIIRSCNIHECSLRPIPRFTSPFNVLIARLTGKLLSVINITETRCCNTSHLAVDWYFRSQPDLEYIKLFVASNEPLTSSESSSPKNECQRWLTLNCQMILQRRPVS